MQRHLINRVKYGRRGAEQEPEQEQEQEPEQEQEQEQST